jgi:hypothetical protein
METIMSDLLKEAIADAKAVRETALQNAKMALEEAFTPHLKSMLSAKLAEEDDEDEENPFADEEEGEEEEAEDMARYEEEGDENPNPFADEDEESEPEMEPEMEEEGIIEIDGVKYAPVVSEEDEEEIDSDEEADDSEELDLEAVIKELELEIAESDESDEDLEEEAVEETVNITEEEDEDEDEDEKEVDEQSTPESDDDTKVHESVSAMQTELNEYKEAVTYLRDKLHEVNILNAKLLYTNRLFKEFALSNNQKMKIVETFDRAQTTREIKLVYSTLAESYSDTGSVKKNEIKEFASKKAGTTAPKTKIISEENNVADRFKKLAGILND